MSDKAAKKQRRFMRRNFMEKVSADASRYLRAEIFRLGRIRDILGILLIIAVVAIIFLSAMLFNSLH